MITSFFAPKSKRSASSSSSSSSSKRPRTAQKNEEDDATTTTSTKKRAVVTPSSSSLSSSDSKSKSGAAALTEETATLLSLLRETDQASWRRALEKHFSTAKFISLAKFVAKERASKTVYPPPELTFSALNLTPLHKVKVVVVGQDPYHQPNQGHGLSFSVPHGIKIPPSLRNIYKELNNDSSVTQFSSVPQHGNLERWAKQGVLLLNNVLTVRRGEAASHAKKGWEQFTDGVISAVMERDAQNNDSNDDDDETNDDGGEKGTGVVFLLWGKPASAKAQTVLAKFSNNKRSKHAVIMTSHPSPLGATKTKSPFMGSKCFSRANEELVKRGWKPIDWRVDGAIEEDRTTTKNAGKKEETSAPGEVKLGEEDANLDV